MMDWITLISGLVVITFGADFLVRSASAVAHRLGISTLVVGMTIVAYGTSAPELAVSLIASLRDSPGVAIGNVVGSNITNLGLVLGLAAMIRPLKAEASLLKRELPFMIIAAAMIPALSLDGTLDRGDGIALLLGAILFTSVCMIRAISEGRASKEARAPTPTLTWLRDLGLMTLGLIGLVGGGELLVRGATGVASSFGVSDRVIGLTVVAFGTSVPELATSLVAAARGEMDLAVGNVIGSNIFNVFFILGAATLARPLALNGAPVLSEDVVIMLILSLAMVPVIATGQIISRREGLLLTLAYLGFLLTIFL